MRFLAFIIFIIYCSSNLQGQNKICGHVDIEGKSLENVEITAQCISSSSSSQIIYMKTDENGNFCFTNLIAGNYHISAAKKDYRIDVFVVAETDITGLQLTLKKQVKLDEVQIRGKSSKGLKSEHSIKTGIVDLGNKKYSPTSVEEMMNQASGIRVRNSGGVGGNANIIVGGFAGSSVRFLIDGIPIDYLGTSMGVTKIPSNMAGYIEIYKGVLPTEIGVDALGAAINIVTKNERETSGRFSYQAGSFNTHQFTINSYLRTSKNFSYGINLFGIYSGNNFKVDNLPFVDEETGKTKLITARLFHNRYRQLSGDVFINFSKRKWVDLLSIKINSYGLDRQMQNDFVSRNRAYGKVLMKEYAYAVPSIHYQKDFFKRKLSVSQFFVFSQIGNQLVDSLKNAYYDWKGNRHENISGSETGNDLSNLKEPIIRTRTNNLTYRGLFKYRFSERQYLVLNLINTNLYRIADDLSAYNSRTRITYNRFIAGLGYQYFLFDKRLEGLSQVKLLLGETKGKLNNLLIGAKDSPHLNKGHSFAQSIKYQTKNGWLFRTSIENTFRLPDQMEIFGDNVFILPNLTLKPERSLNVNAGLGYRHKDKFFFEVNGYFRNLKDMIRLEEVTQFQANFLNLDKVRGYGIEIETSWEVKEGLKIEGNLTYNDFRFQGSNDFLSQNNHFINARVSNMPFCFGNTSISYQFKYLFSKDDRLKIYWNYSYVHQFYLDFVEKQYEPEGLLGLFGQSEVYTSRVIPIQHVNSAGLIWQMMISNKRLFAVSLEGNNLFDYPIYNDFKMQSPGRSFYVKVSFEM